MKILLSTLLLLFTFNYCSDEQLQHSVAVEQYYAELWLSLEQEADLQIAASLTREMDLLLDPLRKQWRIPLNKLLSKKRRDHLDEAEAAFADVRPALLAGEKALAAIQLDRSIQELREADPDAFELLYLGQAYDFLTNWMETRKIVNDQMLCLMEWQEYVWWANITKSSWQAIAPCKPDLNLYDWSPAKLADFINSRQQLEHKLEDFWRDTARGDQCSSQDYAASVDTALYSFIGHFGLSADGTQLAN